MDYKNLLNPSSTTVIVIDKQAGYFDPVLVAKRNKNLPNDSAQVLKLIDDFIEQSRQFGVEVIWTQMVENADFSPKVISQLIKSKPDGVTTMTRMGDPSFDFYGKTKPVDNEKVFTKYRHNAFAKTQLASYLQSKNISTVILVGGYATRCVLSSVVGAGSEDLLCVIPKGLVINQSNFVDETNLLYDIVDAIFGVTMEVNEIVSTWEQISQTVKS